MGGVTGAVDRRRMTVRFLTSHSDPDSALSASVGRTDHETAHVPTTSSMHPNAESIRRFYTCFQTRDGAGMVACYHPDIHFSDEVFPDLRGARAGAMWRMLCERATDLKIEFRDIEADDRSGRAHWEAWYTFTSTGREVHNVIDAQFQFERGKIVRHQDSFNFWRWATQALGPMGRFLGWSGFLKHRVREQAARNLDVFVQRHQASPVAGT